MHTNTLKAMLVNLKHILNMFDVRNKNLQGMLENGNFFGRIGVPVKMILFAKL